MFSEIISEAVMSASSCPVPDACPMARARPGALADLVGDEPVTVGGAVLVDVRGAGRGVAHAVHRFAQGCARFAGQRDRTPPIMVVSSRMTPTGVYE
jgi:hypothetical protein